MSVEKYVNFIAEQQKKLDSHGFINLNENTEGAVASKVAKSHKNLKTSNFGGTGTLVHHNSEKEDEVGSRGGVVIKKKGNQYHVKHFAGFHYGHDNVEKKRMPSKTFDNHADAVKHGIEIAKSGIRHD